MINRWLITTTISTLILVGCSSDEPASTPTTHSEQSHAEPAANSMQGKQKPSATKTVTTTVAKTKTEGHVVGKVGSHLITDQDIDAAFAQMPANFQKMKSNPAMRANILNNLMTRLALTQKAEQLGIANDPAIRSKIERAQSSILLQELNRRQRNKIASRSDQERQAYYRANIARFTTPEQVHVQHILLKSKKLADKLLKQLQQGADFSKLAKRYSEDISSKDRGGDIGTFPHGRMAPAFEKAAFALTTNGALAGPIKTRFGYHIIQRLGYTAAGKKPFDEVKKQIDNEMQQQHFRNWVEKVKKEMGLTVIDPRYQRRNGHPRPHPFAPQTHP